MLLSAMTRCIHQIDRTQDVRFWPVSLILQLDSWRQRIFDPHTDYGVTHLLAPMSF